MQLIQGKWELAAPAHWKAELCNVAWKAARFGRIGREDSDRVIARASALTIESVDVSELWQGALARALQFEQPPYDTLFIELAFRLDTNVASYDRRLRAKFPSIVRSPAEILAS